MRLDGLFGLYHVIFLLITIALGSATIYIFYAKLKDEYKRAIGLKILAAIWFIFAFTHQIVYIHEQVVLKHVEGWTWAMLLPFTYCSFLSIVTPLVLIFFKKNNHALHCLTYFCFFGGFSVFFAPWLNGSPFFLPSNILALIYHAFMFVMSILLLITKYVKPSMKRFYVYPVGVALIVLVGVFEKYVLKFPVGMMVGKPLLDSMPHLTSWWGLWLGGSFLVLVFIFFYEFAINKKEAKEIFDFRGMLDDTPFKKKKK